MSRNNTGNPLGSNAFLDFEDNVKNLDEAVNSTAMTFRDRMGRLRPTVAGGADPSGVAQVAADAADRAETARDAAFVNADVYPDVATGLAAVANGEQFQVLSADGMEYRRYRKDSEIVAVEVGDGFPSPRRITLIDDRERRYTANGRRLDMFEVIGKPILHLTGEDSPSSVSFTQVLGGGLDVVSQSSSARSILELPYFNSGEGINLFELHADIITSGTALEVGIAFGNLYSDVVTLSYTPTGIVRCVSSDGQVVHSIASAGASRAYANGDSVKVGVLFRGESSSVFITAPSGLVEEYPVPPGVFPLGHVWLMIRGGSGVNVIYKSLKVDGVTQLALESTDVTGAIDIFPDPQLEGKSAGSLWNGVVVTEDDDLAGYFEASGANVFSWDIATTGAMRPGAKITYEFERKVTTPSGNAARNTAIFYDALGAEISRTEVRVVTQADTWEKGFITAVVPSNAVRLTLWAGANNSVTWQRAPVLRSDKASLNLPAGGPSAAIITDRKVYVSPTGDDGNSGASGQPLRTLAAAAASEKVQGGGDIILMQGDYQVVGLNLTAIAQQGVLTIQSYPGQRARIVRGASLTGITKTAGRTKVYQAASAAAPGMWVWQHDVPDLRTLIALADRSAYQQGREYRLPSTRLRQASSIEAIDSAADNDPCWYWEDGTLYFSIYGGGDGTTADIRIPSAFAALTVGAGSRFQMVGMDMLYGSLTTPYADSVLLHDVRAFFTAGNAIRYDACGNFRSEYCEAAGAENDGFNSHNTADPNYRDSVGIHLGNWAHDNYGDGHSDHACSLVQFDGGLYEYNGKAGIVPANGSHAIARNSHARHNGLVTPNGGGGFAVTNATSSFDPGIGTQFDLYGCVSEYNSYNFMCGPANVPGGGSGGATDANHAMKVYNGLSRGAIVAGYFAREGILTATDCRDADSSSAKLEQDGGVVAVVSTSVLT